MSLRVRFGYPTGATLVYSIERLSDGTFYDFAAGAFAASPADADAVAALTEGTERHVGRYAVTLVTDPDEFTDGDYAIGIHDADASNLLIALGSAAMFGGDDATVFPEPGDGVSAGSIAVAVLAAAVEAGVDVKGALALAAAGAAGKLTGATGEASTITIKGAGTDTDRVVAQVDEFGNRTSVTLTLP